MDLQLDKVQLVGGTSRLARIANSTESFGAAPQACMLKYLGAVLQLSSFIRRIGIRMIGKSRYISAYFATIGLYGSRNTFQQGATRAWKTLEFG
jgi:hypothetical protein